MTLSALFCLTQLHTQRIYHLHLGSHASCKGRMAKSKAVLSLREDGVCYARNLRFKGDLFGSNFSSSLFFEVSSLSKLIQMALGR